MEGNLKGGQGGGRGGRKGRRKEGQKDGYLFTYIYINNFNFIQTNIENTIDIFIIVLLISLISQLGDIIISYFKRLSKIKNTGKIIPGHGGLLDRIDGMIFAFPFSYLIFYLEFII